MRINCGKRTALVDGTVSTVWDIKNLKVEMEEKRKDHLLPLIEGERFDDVFSRSNIGSLD